MKSLVLDNIYDKVSKEVGISKKDVKEIYEAYWYYIKTKIQELPLKEELSEEEFNSLQLNYRIQGLGTFYCKYDYKKLQLIKEYYNKRKI